MSVAKLEAADIQTESAGADNAQPDAPLSEDDQQLSELIDVIKRWRSKSSAALGIPAYRILTNATIERLAQAKPTTTQELQIVSGIGPATLEQFGYDLVELIRGAIQGPSSGDPTPPLIKVEPESKQSDAYWTWRLFRDGYSASQIAAIRGMDPSKLANDLKVAAAAGHAVRPEWERSSDG